MSELMQACVEVWESDPEAYHYNPVGYIALGPAVQEPDLTEIRERHERIGYRSELIVGEGPVHEHMQALFPDSRFVALIRHPVAVAGATRQFGHVRRLWRRMSYSSLIEHWLHCHELLIEDAAHIEHLLVMRYEEFVASPDERLADVYRFIGIAPRPSGLEVKREINDGYFRRWALARRGPGTSADIASAIGTMEERVNRFGYSLKQPLLLTPLEKVG